MWKPREATDEKSEQQLMQIYNNIKMQNLSISYNINYPRISDLPVYRETVTIEEKER